MHQFPIKGEQIHYLLFVNYELYLLGSENDFQFLPFNKSSF